MIKSFRNFQKLIIIKNHFKLIILFVFSLYFSCSQPTINCEIKSSKGNIIIELYPEKAPITVANFLNYVDHGLYNNSSFFRVCTPQNEADREIKIEVIQGGNIDETKSFAPIKIETTEQTGIKHLNGTVSMARLGPDTATSQFFICINDQPELDYQGKRNPDGQGFAAFGQVIEGMDVVLKIQKQKDEGQYLVKPIVIKSIKRIR
ncbi:peptidylprolyl isomerase [Yeosuana sp. MJ-SS3]|uniref:Peptidyl-prolyl cis-trans isomerase n=1 Tax=Gilvirhabdus luticola TaxID=3079858 RepID=A0ABU3U4C4_9FLAO|nr:peptidylprolyl isomerase [Yeosuana sp. MJ-SS3]MDU8885259.1 peptidylprolyl isomerase [Yeosuana sp. MJ-SS3]